MKSVLICGAGQLGSRYLQGISKYINPIYVYVNDVSRESLKISQERWQETLGNSTIHKAEFNINLDNIPNSLDLVILSSTSPQRHLLIEKILSVSKVKNWVLEKVLAQNIENLLTIQDILKSNENVWVNTPRRMIPWYQELKKHFEYDTPIQMEVIGGPWGLACNSVHFLDLLEWFTDESLIYLDTSNLEHQWYPAKRSGFFEVFGTLKGFFSKGSEIILTSNQIGEPNYKYKIKGKIKSWEIDEKLGIATSSVNDNVPGYLPYQSELTSILLKDILDDENCLLPTLNNSIQIHLILIESLLSHWKSFMDSNATIIPIT